MEDLRERLTDLADEVPQRTAVPPGLVKRARRRVVLVVGATFACVVLVAIGATAGVRAILRAEPARPAVPSPSPPVGTFDDRITVMASAFQAELPLGAVVLDPDGEPSAPTNLRVGRWGIPLEWAPEGERLLLTLPGGSLLVRAPDGIVTPLAVHTGGFWGGSWSPDGSKVVFGRASGERTSLHVIDADGTNERVLLEASGTERFLYPSWSPNGDEIAFIRVEGFEPVIERSDCDAACQRRNDRGAQVWVVNADGTDARPMITEVPVRASSYNAPDWSPRGPQVVFSGYVGTGEGDVQVFVGDASDATIQITAGSDDAMAPTWSPDGTRIAFVREVGTEHDLRIVDHLGEDERSLLSLSLPSVYEWSPVLWDELPAF